MAIEHWLRLAMTEGIGPILIRRIIDAAGSAQAACEASVNLLRNIEGIGTAKANAIHASMRSANVDDELARCAKLGVTLICPDHASYPAPPSRSRVAVCQAVVRPASWSRASRSWSAPCSP